MRRFRHSERSFAWSDALLLVAPLAFVALSWLRAWRIERNAGDYTGCHGCFYLATLGHDAWLLLAMLVALVFGCLSRYRWLRGVSRLVAIVILLLAAADVAIDALFAQRLYLADLLRFGANPVADLSVLRATLASANGRWAALAAIGLMVVCAGILPARKRQPRMALGFAVAALACCTFAVIARTQPVRYVHRLLVYNVLEANLPQGRIEPFSAPFIARQQVIRDAMQKRCERIAFTDATRPPADIVIVLVESLSAWHSRLLGSEHDWTPKLDAIARENHYFTHFYANGFTTSTGEVALLDARVPFNPPGESWLRFANYSDARGSIPDIAHRIGHQAAFFTTGDLGFLDLGNWLQALGFDVVDGNTNPFYSGMKRWQFGAAEDAALYARYLDWLATRTDTRPAVAVLLTVSSHPPFVDPRSGNIDPPASFGYVDDQLDRFYRELRQRGFFRDGILMILGDHRSMTPLHDAEYQSWGERAFARVPLIIAGNVDMPAVVDTPFQQADIAASIAYRGGLETCRDMFAGSLLRPDPQPPRYLVHVRGDDRNRVDVYHGEKDVSGFHLDGDASHWIDTQPADAASVAAWIDTQRQAAAGTENMIRQARPH